MLLFYSHSLRNKTRKERRRWNPWKSLTYSYNYCNTCLAARQQPTYNETHERHTPPLPLLGRRSGASQRYAWAKGSSGRHKYAVRTTSSSSYADLSPIYRGIYKCRQCRRGGVKHVRCGCGTATGLGVGIQACRKVGFGDIFLQFSRQ